MNHIMPNIVAEFNFFVCLVWQLIVLNKLSLFAIFEYFTPKSKAEHWAPLDLSHEVSRQQ